MSVNDSQVGGSHYRSEYQHWDFVQDCLCGLYLEGCITKYVSRWRKKNGLQDLLKAQHYLAKLTSLLDDQILDGGAGLCFENKVTEFCKANNLDTVESKIIMLAATWTSKADLVHMAVLLEGLMREVKKRVNPREKIAHT